MFEGKIIGDTLKDGIEALTIVVDEARIHYNNEGLYARNADPSYVAMVEFELSSKAFESYKTDSEEGLITLDLKKMQDILELANRTDIVELRVDDNKMLLSFGDVKYTIGLLSPYSIKKEPKVPKIDSPVHLVLNGKQFRWAIKAAEKISDNLALGCVDETFFMEAVGDADTMRLELLKDQLIDISRTDGKTDEVKSLFSLEFLLEMSKAVGKAPEIAIDIGRNIPLKMRFDIADGNGTIRYLLAPRIEQE
jgi:proliferating cell nuclear antigen